MMKLKESDLRDERPPMMFAFDLPMGGKYAVIQDEMRQELFETLNGFVKKHPVSAYDLANELNYYVSLIGANALVQPIPNWDEIRAKSRSPER